MWTPLRQLFWISGSAALFGSVAAQTFSGELTTYGLGATMSGNCNFMTAPPGATENYAAINGPQWDSLKNCGRCAEVSCDDSRCTSTKTAVVYIVDQCPGCKQGDLDVSPSVFKTVTGNGPGRFKTKWKFVDCPITGNLKYCLKSGSNPYYAAIQPANAAAGIKTMTINSKATTMIASAYYYVLESNINLSAVKVAVTSLSGETVTETVSLTAGQCTTGTSQFKAGSSAPSSPAVTPSTGPSPATDAPATPPANAPPVSPPTAPGARPTPTTRRPNTPSTPRPPRTETTRAPTTPKPAASDADNGDGDDNANTPPAAPVPTTPSAPATPAAPAPNAAPSTPSAPAPAPAPTKKKSCRRVKR